MDTCKQRSGEISMIISAYQIDNVIKAYNKQSRMKIKSSIHHDITSNDKYGVITNLSVGKSQNDEAYKAISYNLLDIILNAKER